MSPAETTRPAPGEPEFLDSLRQAFARQPANVRPEGFQPWSVTVAVSREAGSRGGTIARRVGKKLGWQVYNQELLEYLAQERHLSRDLFDVLDDAAAAWVEERLAKLLRDKNLSRNPSIAELARVILAIGARGEAVILGRGAGTILPAASTVNVRIVAPLDERIGYMSQLERLTPEQAAEQVRKRDSQRGQFVESHFHRKPGDIHQYDLLLNSRLLGEDLCARLIVEAARGKLAARGPA
jgi:cytidylate kinase